MPQQETPESAPEERIKEVDSKEVFSEGKLPERYTVAGKTLHSGVVRASDLFKKAEDTDLSKPKENFIHISVDYCGETNSNRRRKLLLFRKGHRRIRQGRGQTQTQDGNTAYEGNYHNDMRDEDSAPIIISPDRFVTPASGGKISGTVLACPSSRTTLPFILAAGATISQLAQVLFFGRDVGNLELPERSKMAQDKAPVSLQCGRRHSFCGQMEE